MNASHDVDGIHITPRGTRRGGGGGGAGATRHLFQAHSSLYICFYKVTASGVPRLKRVSRLNRCLASLIFPWCLWCVFSGGSWCIAFSFLIADLTEKRYLQTGSSLILEIQSVCVTASDKLHTLIVVVVLPVSRCFDCLCLVSLLFFMCCCCWGD